MSGDIPARRAIVTVLRWGASLATLLMAGGILLLLVSPGGAVDSRYSLQQPETLIRNLFVHPSPSGYASVGLLLLVITPLARLVVTAVGFGLARDWKYAGISVGVLVVIFLGIALGE